MLRKFFVAVIASGLISCSVHNESDDNVKQVENLFKKKPSISIKKSHFETHNDKLGRVMGMKVIDTSLVLLDLPQIYLGKIYSTNTKTFTNFAKIGEGPNEFMFPTIPQIFQENGNTKILMFNASKRKESIYLWEDILNNAKGLKPIFTRNVDVSMQRYIYSTKLKGYIGVGIYKSRFVQTDTSGKIISEIGRYPFEDTFKKISFSNLAMAYQGEFATNSDGSKLAFATSNSPNIDILQINDSNEIKLISRHFGRPEFIPSTNSDVISATFSQNNRMGFLGIQADDRYIYVLYSGKTLEKGFYKSLESKYIYVFDWDGNAIYKLELDSEIYAFCLDKENQKIFGIIDAHTPQVVIYNLPNL